MPAGLHPFVPRPACGGQLRGRLTLTQTGLEELAGKHDLALSVRQSRIARLARELLDG